MTAIRSEVFIADLQEKLFAGNSFIKFSKDHDAFVSNKTVHVPQAGAIGNVTKNRTVYPAAIAERNDTDLTYDIDSFDLDPIRVGETDKFMANYAYRDSIMSQQINTLNNEIGLEYLHSASGAALTTAGGQIILTTGTGSTTIGPPTSTLTLKGLTLKDVADAAAKMDGDDVSMEGRYLDIPANVYWDFVENNKAQLLSLDFQGGRTQSDIASGIVSKVYGFNILTRSYTSVYTDGAIPTLKAVGAAAATDDTWGIVGWQKDMMSRALGGIKAFVNPDQAAYYADIISSYVLFGSSKLRTDGKGIVTIVQNT